MKTLLLMRHAKSSWKHPELEDQARPLAKRGERDAHRMGELIERRELIPQLILSSSAVRAAETARIFRDQIGAEIPIELLDSLYLAEAESYIGELGKLDSNLERIMVIGHNPGLESLLQILSGEIESLPTAVVAYITLPIQNWSELNSSTEGELVELWRPKEVDGKEKKKAKKTEPADKQKKAAPAEKAEKPVKEKKVVKTEQPAAAEKTAKPEKPPKAPKPAKVEHAEKKEKPAKAPKKPEDEKKQDADAKKKERHLLKG